VCRCSMRLRGRVRTLGSAFDTFYSPTDHQVASFRWRQPPGPTGADGGERPDTPRLPVSARWRINGLLIDGRRKLRPRPDPEWSALTGPPVPDLDQVDPSLTWRSNPSWGRALGGHPSAGVGPGPVQPVPWRSGLGHGAHPFTMGRMAGPIGGSQGPLGHKANLHISTLGQVAHPWAINAPIWATAGNTRLHTLGEQGRPHGRSLTRPPYAPQSPPQHVTPMRAPAEPLWGGHRDHQSATRPHKPPTCTA